MQRQQDKQDKEGEIQQDLALMGQKAEEAHKRLVGKKILFEGDKVRNSRSGKGLSENFVKLFIRYLKRSFPELEDCVKVYYFASGGFNGTRYNKYWGKIKEFKRESKKNNMIYFVVNQGVLDEGKKGERSGHTNLTVVYNGKYKVFDSASGWENVRTAVGDKKYGKIIENNEVIQADMQNCTTITLGYMESLMKQISKKKKEWEAADKNESGTELGRKKGLSEHIAEEMDTYSNLKPSESKFSDKMRDLSLAREKMKRLLPPKYIRYFQSRSRRDAIIGHARYMVQNSADERIRQKWENIANELEKARKKYDWPEQPLKDLLYYYRFVNNSYDAKWSGEVGDIKVKTFIQSDILHVEKGKNDVLCLGKKRFKFTRTINNYVPLVSGFDDNSTDQLQVKKELEKNKIYRSVCENPQQNMTINLLKKLGRYRKEIKGIIKSLNRSDGGVPQMKRRKDMLKIDSFVKTLEENGIDPNDEIAAVDTI